MEAVPRLVRPRAEGGPDTAAGFPGLSQDHLCLTVSHSEPARQGSPVPRALCSATIHAHFPPGDK